MYPTTIWYRNELFDLDYLVDYEKVLRMKMTFEEFHYIWSGKFNCVLDYAKAEEYYLYCVRGMKRRYYNGNKFLSRI